MQIHKSQRSVCAAIEPDKLHELGPQSLAAFPISPPKRLNLTGIVPELTLPVMRVRMEDGNRTFEMAFLALSQENVSLCLISKLLISVGKTLKTFFKCASKLQEMSYNSPILASSPATSVNIKSNRAIG